jgi:hypothetical protein
MKQILVIIFLTSALQAHAQIGGTLGYTFLNLTPSARTAALSSTNISGINDVSSVTVNPATLSLNHNHQIGSTYFNYFSGINYGLLSYAHKVKTSIFAYSLQYANYGKFKEADETGIIIGEFKAFDYCLNITYSKPLNKDTNWALGGAIKTIYSNYYQNQSVAIAADVALLYNNPSLKFSASAVIKNAGVPVKLYNNQKIALPFEIQTGVSKGLEHVPLVFYFALHNLQKPNLTYIDSAKLITKNPLTGQPVKQKKNYADHFFRHFKTAVELNATKNFSIRLGYDYKQRAELKINERMGIVGFSFGVGIKTKKFAFDYGRVQFHRAGATNLFTCTFLLNSFFHTSNN